MLLFSSAVRYNTDYMKWRENRILVDTAGYLLIVASALTGWLPGPGGLPLFIGGLGLLSIHNKWARDLREYVLTHGGTVVQKLFPKHVVAQWAYDIVAIALFVLAAFLAWNHAAIWQVSLGVSLFFMATFISLMNRERLAAFNNRRKTKRTPKA
ncbi:hypothetical protein KA016_03410 [Candidatus Saccharibacteria bacterium]|nr:hypothetical protein [Candidatus Saccharibacteria bacterium]